MFILFLHITFHLLLVAVFKKKIKQTNTFLYVCVYDLYMKLIYALLQSLHLNWHFLSARTNFYN